MKKLLVGMLISTSPILAFGASDSWVVVNKDQSGNVVAYDSVAVTRVGDMAAVKLVAEMSALPEKIDEKLTTSLLLDITIDCSRNTFATHTVTASFTDGEVMVIEAENVEWNNIPYKSNVGMVAGIVCSK